MCGFIAKSKGLNQKKKRTLAGNFPVGPEDDQATTGSDYLMTADGFVSKELQAA